MNSNPRGTDPSSNGPGTEDVQRRLLDAAVRHSQLPLNELWLYYFSIGGSAGEYEIEAFLSASYSLPPMERDLLAHAVNEMIDLIPPAPRAPYSSDVHKKDSGTETRDRENFGHSDDDGRS